MCICVTCKKMCPIYGNWINTFSIRVYVRQIARLLCNKIEIDQFQCVFCCFLGNYDRIISGALDKQNRNRKKTHGV